MIDHQREDARRKHRMVAILIVFQCWIRLLDSIYISKVKLLRLLGLQVFKEKRLKWVEEDLKEFFPFVNLDDYGIKLSRVNIDDNNLKDFKIWGGPSEDQLMKLHETLKPFCSVQIDEKLLSSYLSLIAQGQISPNEIFPNT
jgi:hypothetical protein